jgi:cytochrome P450
VRVAPGHVAIADLAAFKEIHRIGSGFCKTEFYHHLTPTEGAKPPYGLFQMTDPKDHASRRKLLAKGFTVNSLRETWEPIVMEKVQQSIDGMKLEAKRSCNEVDIRKWWLLMASDIVSHVMFGQSFGGIQTGKVS